MRLIDADALEKVLDEKFQTHYGKSIYQFIHDFFRCVIRLIKKAPTIDPESLRTQGEWIVQDIGRTKFSCSHCKARNYAGHEKYCPNCGAKMKGAGDNA